ncbi:zinc-binding protein [Gregarina niphandrodes]|uniref:Zinc-binding protein n=1 Tax=Gregarina niphandrodes TaxID=110365 RepID=A0A023B8M3_GRENI|nr:zinc-binding protein [Gregarina niphandrodes]EZG69273.1 zinc-binding protein [Gregarina niphandrodes]|eukprot:XP_011134451.1 zinc-binding protein [Gregarina niphandrodes]
MVCEHQPALLWAAEHQHWTEHHHHSAGHGSGAKQHQGPDKHHQKPVEHYQGPGEHSSAGDGLVVASHGLVHEHFRCRCPRSLPVFDQDTLQCRRHDACLDANPCDPTTSFCVSSDEGATADCLCHQGFEWDERRGQCVDVDECARGTHKCPALISTCVNSPGGYECECSRLYGFANQLPVHNRACVNFNECVEIPHVCGHLPCCKDLQPSTNPILPHSGYECSDFDNFVSDQPPEEIIVSAKDLPPPFGLPPFGLPSFGLPEPWPAPSSGNLGSLYGGLPSYSELPSYVGAPSYVGLPAQESFTYRDVYHDDGYSDPAYSHVSVPRQVEPYQDEPYKVEPYQVEPHLGEGYKVAGRRLGVSSLLVGRGPLPKFNVSSMARGNQRELARAKNLKKQAEASKAHSTLKEKDKAMTILCKVCRQAFMCTSTKQILTQHVDAKHPKNQYSDCFDELK